MGKVAITRIWKLSNVWTWRGGAQDIYRSSRKQTTVKQVVHVSQFPRTQIFSPTISVCSNHREDLYESDVRRANIASALSGPSLFTLGIMWSGDTNRTNSRSSVKLQCSLYGTSYLNISKAKAKILLQWELANY